MNGGPWLIAGLGNPGRAYRGNRHNVGFMVLDALAERWGLEFSRVQFQALVADRKYEAQKVFLAKPQTMMNLSGRAVRALASYYHVPDEHLIVVYDDLDLPTGSIRLRPFGGTGGHRGMESIASELGRDSFPRLRIGIGRPPGRMDPADYVLQDFSVPELETIEPALAQAAACLAAVLADGLEAAMTQYNGAPGDP